LIKGYLSIVLHAHLPFIRHPEYESFMEENWLFEGMIETYIPLLNVFDKLLNKNINFRLTMSISPSLCEMFADKLLQDRFIKRLNKLIELSKKELKRTYNTEFYNTAKMYHKKLKLYHDIFINKYDRNIINGFKYFQESGNLEIITSNATHAFMPLLNNKNSENAQIEIGINNYIKHFNTNPKGFWNPECAYYPGLEDLLKKHNIKYFFVDTHGILYAENRPKYGIFAPIKCKNDIAVFGREIESSKQVWSATEGYPGDPFYREFYRDIGYDLPYDYIKPYLHSDGIRMMTGFKYYRITKNGSYKEPYDPQLALDKIKYHVHDFINNRERQIEKILKLINRQPIIVAPYDAELFGHWWFEGPDFIYYLCKYVNKSKSIKMINPSEYLNIYKDNQITTPSMSTWGNKGYMDVWLNQSNDWIYKHLHECADKMVKMANKYTNTKNNLTRRLLNQMARELLIAQTSCWAFIISTGTTVEYATKKIKEHIRRFIYIYNMIKNNKINLDFLKTCEWCDNIFPEIDYMSFNNIKLNN